MEYDDGGNMILLGMMGTTHDMAGDSSYDVIKALHKVIEEITGYDPSPPPRRIGFY